MACKSGRYHSETNGPGCWGSRQDSNLAPPDSIYLRLKLFMMMCEKSISAKHSLVWRSLRFWAQGGHVDVCLRKTTWYRESPTPLWSGRSCGELFDSEPSQRTQRCRPRSAPV